MKTIQIVLVLVLSNLLMGANAAAQFDLSGVWYTEDNQPLHIFKKESQVYIAYKSIDYVDPNGYLTGEKIEYYFEFSGPVLENNQTVFNGHLRIFDTRYSCSLDNGAASIRVLSDSSIDVFLPKINFKVRTVRRVPHRVKRRYPRYCYDPYYQTDYICGWDWRYPPRERGRVISRSCEITERTTVGSRLTR